MNLDFAGATVQMSGNVVAIYSPQPLIIKHPTDNLGSITVGVTDTKSGKYVNDTRTMRALEGGGYGCTFDLAPMLRAVLPDIRDLLANLQPDVYYSEKNELARVFKLEILNGTGESQYTEHQAIYAALDWRDKYENNNDNIIRTGARYYPHFPMTLSAAQFDDYTYLWPVSPLWPDMITIAEPNTQPMPIRQEVPINYVFEQETALIEEIKEKGKLILNVSGLMEFSNGKWYGMDNGARHYVMRVDARKPGEGVFLRWLNRDGTLGYWLFTRSKVTHAVKASNSFTRHIPGSDLQPFTGHDITMQDHTDTETWTLGATDLTEAEYNYLLGITASPVLDMLDGNDWIEVGIVPATYTSKQPRSGLDRRRELEIQITLPGRELIKL